MSRYLNETGRHIVYSCEWPMYESAQGGKVGSQLTRGQSNIDDSLRHSANRLKKDYLSLKCFNLFVETATSVMHPIYIINSAIWVCMTEATKHMTLASLLLSD